MSIFKKKGQDFYNVLNEKYVPTPLPNYGMGLHNFVTSEYPMNKKEVVKERYEGVEKSLEDVIATCDKHSSGTECDNIIDGQHKHLVAEHEVAIATNENQIARIEAAREMRKESLNLKINPLKEKIAKLESEIEPLENLRSQFQISIGHRSVSAGLLVTLIAMIVDACLNYSFLQNVLLSNAALLMLTVIGMSVMSDGSMMALGVFLSRRKEKFVSKPLFMTTCISLVAMFLLSIVASVMIRWGSMPETYGTINAAGEFVGKTTYSLADYGVTLITAFITTGTGLLSFAFSLDENAHLVSIREHKKKELAKCRTELDPLLNELHFLENAPDLQEWDDRKRAAAEHQIEATRLGLKLHCRKLMAVSIKDADFTERMANSGEALIKKPSTTDTDIAKMPTVIPMNKIC